MIHKTEKISLSLNLSGRSIEKRVEKGLEYFRIGEKKAAGALKREIRNTVPLLKKAEAEAMEPLQDTLRKLEEKERQIERGAKSWFKKRKERKDLKNQKAIVLKHILEAKERKNKSYITIEEKKIYTGKIKISNKGEHEIMAPSEHSEIKVYQPKLLSLEESKPFGKNIPALKNSRETAKGIALYYDSLDNSEKVAQVSRLPQNIRDEKVLKSAKPAYKEDKSAQESGFAPKSINKDMSKKALLKNIKDSFS